MCWINYRRFHKIVKIILDYRLFIFRYNCNDPKHIKKEKASTSTSYKLPSIEMYTLRKIKSDIKRHRNAIWFESLNDWEEVLNVHFICEGNYGIIFWSLWRACRRNCQNVSRFWIIGICSCYFVGFEYVRIDFRLRSVLKIYWKQNLRWEKYLVTLLTLNCTKNSFLNFKKSVNWDLNSQILKCALTF